MRFSRIKILSLSPGWQCMLSRPNSWSKFVPLLRAKPLKFLDVILLKSKFSQSYHLSGQYFDVLHHWLHSGTQLPGGAQNLYDLQNGQYLSETEPINISWCCPFHRIHVEFSGTHRHWRSTFTAFSIPQPIFYSTSDGGIPWSFGTPVWKTWTAFLLRHFM